MSNPERNRHNPNIRRKPIEHPLTTVPSERGYQLVSREQGGTLYAPRVVYLDERFSGTPTPAQLRERAARMKKFGK